jgi:hypothetical protein
LLHKKALFPGSIFAAYLVLGSGSYVATVPKPDAHRDVASFLATTPRRIYRYSVVPGGVFTPEELAAARRSDPVVAAHYADFGRDTRITKLQEDVYVYISYRKGNQIYYSKKKHKVCKGEVVITDGKNYARTRCANRLTKVFKPPALVYNEPKPPEMDIVEAPDTPYADVVPDGPQLTQNYFSYPRIEEYPTTEAQSGATAGPPIPNAFAPSEVILPQFAPLGGIAPGSFAPLASSPGGGGGTPGGGGGTTVPEPTILNLLLAGSTLLLVFRWKWRKRSGFSCNRTAGGI